MFRIAKLSNEKLPLLAGGTIENYGFVMSKSEFADGISL